MQIDLDSIVMRMQRPYVREIPRVSTTVHSVTQFSPLTVHVHVQDRRLLSYHNLTSGKSTR